MTAMGKANKFFSKDRKKKLKQGKIGKKEFKPTGKRGRLVVRNLPFKCNEQQVKKHFKQFGEIKEVQLLRRPDKKLVGCGFVEYTTRLSADKAAESLNGKPFLGRPIYVQRAVNRDKYDEVAEHQENNLKEAEIKEENDDEEKQVKEEPSSDEEEGELLDESEIKKEKINSDDEDDDRNESHKGFKNHKREEESHKSTKKARLIVRNLSFKTTETKLQAHFSQYGGVLEVRLLRRPDNTLVGCGFVEYAKRQHAAKALFHTSGKPFLGRPIIVDWAVAKDKFKQMQERAIKKEIKEEKTSEDEDSKPIDTSHVTVKEEEEEESEESDRESDDDSEAESDESDYKQDEENGEKSGDEVEDKSFKKRPDDIDEGKTVFVKNLPFSASDEEFRECMEQFGPVFYALVCKDKFTERSKGSGFVKFKEKADAEKCLSAGTELTLKETILDPHPALKRTEIQNMKDKTKEKKDNRNLYLVKEGLIIAGTAAAKGVSVPDMERRLQLEQWKTARLRDLNMFVSRDRLVVHNLPPSFNDKKLRSIFLKHAGPNASVTESRVMKDLKKADAAGRGLSKGYGFVSFSRHEDALRALRSINNNPDIFTPTARPIVAFSIENRAVLNNKMKRMQRSKQKNPLCKDYKPEESEAAPAKKARREHATGKQAGGEEPQYAGLTAKPGASVKMRQKYKLTNQAQQHAQDVRRDKREMKMSRQMRRAHHLKQIQVEKKTKKKKIKNTADNDSAFTKLVDKYKSRLLSQGDKRKWYDE